MRNNFAPTTVWAFQAAVAIVLAFLIGDIFHLERSYWAVLTSILLISQTWGESVKKALERVGMTIFGGIIGTLLYFSMNHTPVALVSVIILVTFCIVYCIGYTFMGTAFFVTIFVVFLFAIIGNWDVHILEVRIYETMIGAATAVGTSIVIFPMHSNSSLQASLKNYLDESCHIVSLSFNIVFNQAEKASITQARDQLYKHFRALADAYKISSYEVFFMFVPRKKARFILNELTVLMHYTTNLLETSNFINQDTFSSVILEKFALIKRTMLDNVNNIIFLIDKTSVAQPMQSLQTIITDLNEVLISQLKSQSEQQICAMHGLSFLYYLQKIDEVLLRIEKELK